MAIPFAHSSFPEIYEQALVGPLFRPFAEALLDDVPLAPGARVLDIACGTGIVARLARERLRDTGTVVGIDASPAMLALARRLGPDIDWREGDACRLPLADSEAFDVVTCQQGLQFLADRPAAAREMRRALRNGGRLAVSSWRPDDESALLRELRGVAEQHLGPIADQRHSFGAAELLAALLRDAGFADVCCSVVSRIVRFADAAAFVRLNAVALVGMSPASKAMDREERARLAAVIAEQSAGVVPRYTGASGLAFELVTNMATAAG